MGHICEKCGERFENSGEFTDHALAVHTTTAQKQRLHMRIPMKMGNPADRLEYRVDEEGNVDIYEKGEEYIYLTSADFTKLTGIKIHTEAN